MSVSQGMTWLRRAAILLLVSMLTWWVAAGAHRGWTMTSVPTRVLDEVTGIEAVVYEKRLVPGLDVVGAVAGMSFLMIGVSLLGRSSRRTTTRS